MSGIYSTIKMSTYGTYSFRISSVRTSTKDGLERAPDIVNYLQKLEVRDTGVQGKLINEGLTGIRGRMRKLWLQLRE